MISMARKLENTLDWAGGQALRRERRHIIDWLKRKHGLDWNARADAEFAITLLLDCAFAIAEGSGRIEFAAEVAAGQIARVIPEADSGQEGPGAQIIDVDYSEEGEAQ